MMASFYDVFGNKDESDREIPTEIIELLNRDLPDNLRYVKDKDGNYLAVPRPDMLDKDLTLKTQFDFDEATETRLKQIPRQKWLEYFYRTQKAVPVKSALIGDSKKQIPIEKTMGNPLSDDVHIEGTIMYPQPFPEPSVFLFESAEGDKIPIAIQQQAYDSLTEIKFASIDFPALLIEVHIYSPLIDSSADEKSVTSREKPYRIKYSVTPSKAATVSDAITALRIFKSLQNGTVSINGIPFRSKDNTSNLDPSQLDDMIRFWSAALELESKLNVTFSPNADFPLEDVRLFNELYTCLIQKKTIIWKRPFEHFHMGGYHAVNDKHSAEELIGKEGVCYKFVEGPIQTSLLGAEFDLYSQSEIRDFIITSIEWDDDNQNSGEIYIADAPGNTVKLIRLFITDEEYNVQYQ